MFRHYRVILRELVVSTLLSNTSMSMQLLAIQFKTSHMFYVVEIAMFEIFKILKSSSYHTDDIYSHHIISYKWYIQPAHHIIQMVYTASTSYHTDGIYNQHIISYRWYIRPAHHIIQIVYTATTQDFMRIVTTKLF